MGHEYAHYNFNYRIGHNVELVKIILASFVCVWVCCWSWLHNTLNGQYNSFHLYYSIMGIVSIYVYTYYTTMWQHDAIFYYRCVTICLECVKSYIFKYDIHSKIIKGTQKQFKFVCPAPYTNNMPGNWKFLYKWWTTYIVVVFPTEEFNFIIDYFVCSKVFRKMIYILKVALCSYIIILIFIR